MENHFIKDIDCECGQHHKLPCCEICVNDNAFEMLINYISEQEYNNILVFYGLEDDELLQKMKSCDIKNKNISYIILPLIIPATTLADAIEDKGQDMIVAIGDEKVISFAKYYAYSFSCPIAIFPIGNFTDFTFSQFARLYDGMKYNFYFSQAPSGIFVDTGLNKYNQYQSYYLSSKFISAFDNYLAEIVYKKEYCPRLFDFFKKTMEKYLDSFNKDICKNNKNDIWTLIKIGQAMTFFQQTKYFFGADAAVAEMMSSIRPEADYLELETIALKLILSSYDCFLKDSVCLGSTNLNRHINILSKFLNVPATTVMKNLANSKLITSKEQVIDGFGNYQPYLYGVFKNFAYRIFKIHSNLALDDNVLKKNKYNSKDIELSLALSPDIYDRPTLLHIISLYGYLDKLLD